ncbi:MgtC/SapB family protein [Hippea sp. KM1]|uniref:MgtC/SapB family protein n=1 Tax=Hippea sp. KM1 TaxID=944481 RepID=UPI0009FFD9DB|nr:MgtC/SapB family protein [Hippea sp. KM1]
MGKIVQWMPDWFFLVVLSILLGGIVGLEQESYHRKIEEKHFGGIRTFPLISLLGFSVEYFVKTPLIVGIVFGCFALMIIGEYMYEAFYFNRKGITTEIAGLFTFVVGVILAKGYVIEAVSLSIIITLILSLREFLHGFVEKYIYKKDISAILKFLVVSAVLYPILPDKAFTFLKLNPRSIWLMVVLISSISFAAYFATKLLGSKRGILITALFGGLMSSTAVTLAFSKRSKETPELSCELALGIVLASSIMFIRQLIVMFIIYPSISYRFAIFSVVAFGVGLIFALKKHKSGDDVVEVEFSNPYDLTHALFFGAFYTVILILSRLAHTYLGSKGIYLLGFISGFADVDPLTISMSQLSKTGVIDIDIALISIIISSITNTVIKGVYATIFGHRNVRWIIWKAFAAISIVSVAVVVGLKFL